ncbi:endonuclease NucS domain-containing protein [Methanolobus chelungpuianus]|uniref:Nuclease of the RecB family protein n=1 Tax=Methanolobus chelungpuianus TaxID=502115 RepID=A0AAE3HC30_9EURY|nr:endonuclease NucS domain-containing protein [Methanolobus chelungpuianus]MCQ6963520.1 nuclease of the RecB family protein [Methanolobus chelungpuianus]
MRNYMLCIRNDSDQQEIDKCTSLLEHIRDKHSVSYDILDISFLGDDERQHLTNSIRHVSAAQGIAVKSQGKGPLPISRNTNSLGKICTLLVYDDNKLIGVYPHVKNQKRIDILPYLEKMLLIDDVNTAFDSQSITEADISRMISTFPELIEPGLQFLDTEVEVEGGRIDAVFKDNNGRHLLIEIEIEVGDNAIGQVQRFITYSEKYGIPQNQIRLGFVCAKIPESRLNACKGASIEVYTLCLVKKA